MLDDSADKRAVGAHPESFSGRAHPRWTSWTQADPDPMCFRSRIVDTQHRRAVATCFPLHTNERRCFKRYGSYPVPNPEWRTFASPLALLICSRSPPVAWPGIDTMSRTRSCRSLRRCHPVVRGTCLCIGFRFRGLTEGDGIPVAQVAT